MNCLKVQQLLSDYLDDELTSEVALPVERHLTNCPACAGEWESLRATVRMVGSLGSRECPVDLRGSVLSAISRTPERPAARTLLQRALAVTIGGSAMAACLALPIMIQRFPLRSGELPPLSMSSSVKAEEPPVHVQYNMATVLGSTDGLLLSLPARRAGDNSSDPVR
jgi:hypothetical protein